MATTPDRFAKPTFSRAVAFNPEPLLNSSFNITEPEQSNSRFTKPKFQQYSQVVQHPVNYYDIDNTENNNVAPNRFEIPARTNNYCLQELSSEVQRPAFSQPRTPATRVEIKPFGSAVDRERNAKCTTYGDDTFIEYNPMAFFGPAGLKRINKYFDSVIVGLAKEVPVIPDQIVLKDYAGTSITESGFAELNQEPNKTIDWWADDINTYVTDAEVPAMMEYLDKYNSHKSSYQPGALELLIPEVLDKLTVAEKLIKQYRANQETSKPEIQFRDPGLYEDKTPDQFQVPARNNITRITEPPSRFSLPSRQRFNPDPAEQAQEARIYYDDNCTIKISNFGDAHMLDVYDIKDFLREHGLDSAEIKYKVTLPKNKETGHARDFIYLNFCDDAGMNQALDILLGQRIFYEYGILSVERLEPRARR